MFILQLLGNDHSKESFPLADPNNNDKEQPGHAWEPFGASLQKKIQPQKLQEQTLNNFCQHENESTADLHTRLTVLCGQ